MPALITHYLFGEEALPALPSGSVASQEERDAFLLGCQGPDPFFFHWSSPTTFDAISKLGGTMHITNMSRFFDVLRSSVSRLPERDRGLAEAFSLGMLAHYALDRAVHPFVFGWQFAFMRAGVGLDNDGSQVHAFIESEIDAHMLWLKHGETVNQRPPASFLVSSPRIDLVAGSLLSQVALSVYDQEISAGLYAACVRDMRALYRTIEPQGSFANRALGRVERLVRHGRQSLLFGLSHPVLEGGESPLANESHAEWRDVWSGEASTSSVVDPFEQALGAFGELAASYVGGVDTALITGHLDYHGCYLEDESVPVPKPEL